jgi:hypothetical protein
VTEKQAIFCPKFAQNRVKTCALPGLGARTCCAMRNFHYNVMLLNKTHRVFGAKEAGGMRDTIRNYMI